MPQTLVGEYDSGLPLESICVMQAPVCGLKVGSRPMVLLEVGRKRMNSSKVSES
jgi:hypothetical protein